MILSAISSTGSVKGAISSKSPAPGHWWVTLRCAVVKQASIRHAGVDCKFRCPQRGVAAIGVTSAYDSLEFQVFFSTELAEGHVIDLLQFAYIWDKRLCGRRFITKNNYRKRICKNTNTANT